MNSAAAALDVDAFLAMTRLSSPRTAPDGRRTVVVTTLAPDRKGFRSAVCAVTGDGLVPLTAASPGLAPAGFLPDSSLLFTARREDPTAPGTDKVGEAASLWVLPVGGGEARRLLSPPAGVSGVAVARDAGTVVVAAEVFPDAAGLAEDRARATARDEAGTSALWFDSYPVRFWDHHLAPRAPRLLVLEDGKPRDLTGEVGQALAESSFVVTPDGRTVLTTWDEPVGRGETRRDVVAVDVATGQRRTVASAPRTFHTDLAVSPDGRWLACTREEAFPVGTAPDVHLWLVALDGSGERRLAADLDRWPVAPVFSPDSSAVLFSADDGGRLGAFRVDLAPGAATVRLSADGALSDLTPSPDGATVLALRSTPASPPEVVEIAAAGADQQATGVYAAEPAVPLPGRLEEVTTAAADGTPLRAWLLLPAETAGPHPLVLFIHGGPLNSWNSWSWRWQPQVLAARGYAVLLPDPALSTGYGRAMVQRGWGQWGGTPADDVLALTDAALARADLDGTRTAVTGGSYGGYLTNWLIGHTDRFRCAVTHASLWSLQHFRGTTDNAVWWEFDWGTPEDRPEFYAQWSPATYASAISTPTLVIHGEQDFRVPVSEGLALYTDLQRRGVASALLYFPDENHWVLKPGNAAVWYDAFLGWLDHHLLGEPQRRPGLV